jgi:hypothetical protein
MLFSQNSYDKIDELMKVSKVFAILINKFLREINLKEQPSVGPAWRRFYWEQAES